MPRSASYYHIGWVNRGEQIADCRSKKELEQEIADSKAETYISREKAMEILGKGSTTLWRWKKMGYLVPVTVGAIDRYRMSDIRRILEGGNSNHTFWLLNYCYGQASTEFLW